jgi:hypothetical protein
MYTVYSDLYFMLYTVFVLDGSSEKTDIVLIEPHIMVCIYRYDAKLMCTATFDKEKCAGRQTDDTSPACVSCMKFLQVAHKLELSLKNNCLR